MFCDFFFFFYCVMFLINIFYFIIIVIINVLFSHFNDNFPFIISMYVMFQYIIPIPDLFYKIIKYFFFVQLLFLNNNLVKINVKCLIIYI